MNSGKYADSSNGCGSTTHSLSPAARAWAPLRDFFHEGGEKETRPEVEVTKGPVLLLSSLRGVGRRVKARGFARPRRLPGRGNSPGVPGHAGYCLRPGVPSAVPRGRSAPKCLQAALLVGA